MALATCFGSAPIMSSTPPRQSAARAVAEFTDGAGVDLQLLDAVGGQKSADNLAMLAPFGLVVSYGHFQGPPEANVIAALENGPGYLNSTAVRVFTMHTLDDKPTLRAINRLIARLAEGAIRPLIHARLPLRDARRAHELLEARQVIGKILLKP